MEPIINQALSLIKPHMHVCLGGGHNVANLAKVLATKPELKLHFCTPSELTAQTCEQLGLPVESLDAVGHIDVAFDGCDSITPELTTLKSNGGIHVFEKLYAQNADQYVILAPATRLTPVLDKTVPLTVEVLPLTAPTLERKLIQKGLQVTRRVGQSVASFARTPNGNELLDIHASDWSQIHTLNDWVQSQNGVLATSLFETVVTKLLTFDEDNQVHEYRKEL